jgi:4-hydroxybutyrate CoA-transferase
MVIAQVNKNMPRTWGDGVMHISNFDYLVEADDDLYESKPANIGDVEKAIGENCASLIEDGSTLQLGIGAIPDAVMLFLGDKKELGIHSEMISDGTLELYNRGVITGSKKADGVGKMTISFLMGTKKLYEFANDNPAIEMRTVDYVNHPAVISRQYKMVSVNSAIQVDLQGQFDSEAIALRQFSGVGGQVDFVRGSAMSANGKAIIAMPSVTVKKDGSMISKIAPFLDQGAPVTTSRNDADYLVTEFGVAELKGKTLRQRARNLIAVAHPDVKDPLIEEFEKRFNEKF